MQRPAYRLSLGTRVFDSSLIGSDQPLRALLADSEIGVPASALTIVMGDPAQVSAALGDPVRLELGYDGRLETVFTGQVERLRPGLERLDVLALSASVALTRLRVNQAYENASAGAVVRDLAGQAGITTGTVSDGPALPSYAVSDRKTAYQHCRDLAERAGFDLFVGPDGRLNLIPFTKHAPDHFLAYGADILELEIATRPPTAERVEVWGESPASSEGVDAASWLVRDFRSSVGTSGSGPRLRVSDPAIRTKDAAGVSAAGRVAALVRRATFGFAVILGRGDIKLSDSVGFLGTPDDRLSGSYQVRRARQRLDKSHGFTTRLDLAGGETLSLPGVGGLP